MIKFSIIITLLLIITGCSKAPTYPTNYIQPHRQKISSRPISKNPVVNKLHAEYKRWHYAPYKYGGVCLDGVDCSGLVERIYKDAFGIEIPRTTKEQVKIGKRIKYSQIRPGDLIFFKTGYDKRHVGIYFGGNTFLHTSKKHGVIISSINNPYWRKRYWMCRRVLSTPRAYAAKN
ncbi:NlpC/P60 family protein [Sulfurimonas sp. HSL-1716]|uniref:NlpC/P60 family protein n=1 Tax=Hydrocurvibacter sulfurireducens TaxID=3131937 RepID=UPI0031F8F1AB